MNWKNKTTTTGLRLCKKEDILFHEIGISYQIGLCIDTENIIDGRRVCLLPTTTDSLLKRFPELKEWESLLDAHERIYKLEMKVRDLQEKLVIENI